MGAAPQRWSDEYADETDSPERDGFLAPSRTATCSPSRVRDRRAARAAGAVDGGWNVLAEELVSFPAAVLRPWVDLPPADAADPAQRVATLPSERDRRKAEAWLERELVGLRALADVAYPVAPSIGRRAAGGRSGSDQLTSRGSTDGLRTRGAPGTRAVSPSGATRRRSAKPAPAARPNTASRPATAARPATPATTARSATTANPTPTPTTSPAPTTTTTTTPAGVPRAVTAAAAARLRTERGLSTTRLAHQIELRGLRRLLPGVATLAVLGGLWCGIGALSSVHRPRPVQMPGAVSTPQGSLYVARPGDTLWSIASRALPNGDPRPLVDALQAQLHGAPLEPGDRLVLP